MKLAGSELLHDRQQASDDHFAERIDLLLQHGLLHTDVRLA